MRLQKPAITKLMRYRRRLAGISLPRQIYVVAKVLCGEIFRVRGFRSFGLRLAEIGVTDRCQCHCVHCYAASDQPAMRDAEMTTRELFAILDQVAAMHCVEVCLTGGEPLMRGDIVDLVRYARRKGLLPKINTNGILLTEPLIRQLREAGLAWCLVSIDSAKPGRHDAMRGYAGCYDRAVQSLKTLVRHRVPASIITYADRESLRSGDLADIVALGHELRVDTLRILLPVPLGRWEHANDKTLTVEERDQVRQLLKDPMVTMENPSEDSTCAAGVTKLYIMANGDVTPCTLLPVPYGNVRRQSVREVWDAMSGFARLHKPAGQCPIMDPAFRESFFSEKPPQAVVARRETGCPSPRE